MIYGNIRRSLIATLFAAAGCLAAACDLVETLGYGTPAVAEVQPEPEPRARRGRRRRRRYG